MAESVDLLLFIFFVFGLVCFRFELIQYVNGPRRSGSGAEGVDLLLFIFS